MAKRIMNTTPRQDGFRMPGEFEKQAGMWMLWPERNDNWRDGAKPAQEAFANVAKAIADFEPVTVCVSASQYQNCRAKLPDHIRVVEMANDDAWIRDCGPTFVVNDRGEVREEKSVRLRISILTGQRALSWRADLFMWTGKAPC